MSTSTAFPTSVADSGSSLSGFTAYTAVEGYKAWTNPTSIEATDTTYATSGLNNSTTDVSNILTATAFGFAVSGTINGITSTTIHHATINAARMTANRVQLVLSGAAVGNNTHTNSTFATTDTTATLGGGADLWGTTWTSSNVNDSTFGVANQYQSGNTGSTTASVDSQSLTITYSAGGPTTGELDAAIYTCESSCGAAADMIAAQTVAVEEMGSDH